MQQAIEPFQPSAHDQHLACRTCKRSLLLESVSHDARQVYIQIEWTAKKQLGLCPPMAEIAALMSWPEQKVKDALDVLKGRGLLKGFPGRPGEYRATAYGLKEAIEEAEIENKKLQRALDEEKSHRREAAQAVASVEAKGREMAKLEERLKNQNTVIRALNDAKDGLLAEINRLRGELARAQPAPQPVAPGGPDNAPGGGRAMAKPLA